MKESNNEVSFESGDISLDEAVTAGLNPEQVEAVRHIKGPILVLAGAGSGKTRVLTSRVAHLVRDHGVSAQSILAITFTNKATEEMRARLFGMLGPDAERLWISTFHSAGLRILRQHAQKLSYKNDFVVYDDDDTKSLLKRLLKAKNLDEKRFPVTIFQRAIDQAKNNIVTPDDFIAANKKDYMGAIAGEIYDQYQGELRKANAMDFGDLLMNTVILFKNNPDLLKHYQHALDYLLVDEFQDTNKVQYQFIRMLSHPKRNLFVVGDDDQSIYAFRGATIKNILNFEKDFPEAKVVKLEENYRSTSNILDSANAVIAVNKGRKGKNLWTRGDKGAPVFTYVAEDEEAEAWFITRTIESRAKAGEQYRDMAILYRTNAQTRAIEEALMRVKIPYRIYGGLKFYDRKEIKDVIAYLRLIVNPADSQAFLRIVNTPPRGIGAQTIQSIVDLAKVENLTLFESAAKLASDSSHLARFVELMEELRSSAENKQLGDLIRDVVERSEYGPKLKKLGDPQALSRLENIEELIFIGKSMQVPGLDRAQTLKEFLDRVSLTSGGELPVEESKDREQEVKDPHNRPNVVSLMTLHLAKGLEFPVVFLSGVEEGLLPHYRAIEQKSEEGIEEERRLCYVGMTRAMKSLYLTRARFRGMFSAGNSFGSGGRYREVSRFAYAIPPLCLENNGGDFLSNEESSDWELDDDSWSTDDTFKKPKVDKLAQKEERFSKSLAAIGTAESIVSTPKKDFILRKKR